MRANPHQTLQLKFRNLGEPEYDVEETKCRPAIKESDDEEIEEDIENYSDDFEQSALSDSFDSDFDL